MIFINNVLNIKPLDPTYFLYFIYLFICYIFSFISVFLILVPTIVSSMAPSGDFWGGNV